MTTTVGRVNDGAANAVYIGRPAAGQPWGFGNPFVIGSKSKAGKIINRPYALKLFKLWISASPDPAAKWIRDNVHTLKGKHLQCFCKPHACHGDILAVIADKGWDGLLESDQ